MIFLIENLKGRIGKLDLRKEKIWVRGGQGAIKIMFEHVFKKKAAHFIKKVWSVSLPLQILDEEVNKLQQDVSNIADQGRLLAHKIDLDDHDKAIRIYRQVEDMKVSAFTNQNHSFLWSSYRGLSE